MGRQRANDDGTPDLFDWSSEQERKFEEWLAANHHIWVLFVEFTFDRIRRGFRNYGARDILHRIRWETSAAEDTHGHGDGVTSGFAVNNCWSPWLARKFHREYPEHNGFFRLRRAKADMELQA